MEKVKINDAIEAIIENNLNEKVEEETIELKSCENCRYHENPWIWGRTLHVCCHNQDAPKTSRDVDELFNNCPINGQMKIKKSLIKKYGIIRREKDDWHKNYVAIVDFSPSHWESDGYNPDIDWNDVAVFFYDDEEDGDKMMEMCLDYYNRFGFDEEWTKKRCYG